VVVWLLHRGRGELECADAHRKLDGDQGGRRGHWTSGTTNMVAEVQLQLTYSFDPETKSPSVFSKNTYSQLSLMTRY
jgi:hypothetical protein